MEPSDYWTDLPDIFDIGGAEIAVEARLEAMSELGRVEGRRPSFTTLVAPSLPTETGRFGPFASERWRRFVGAVCLADWACYPRPADRLDFPRALYVTSMFARGFRVWQCQLKNGTFVPVGYTGWYPISAGTFDLMRKRAVDIPHRGIAVPLSTVPENDIFLYIFNASIIEPLRHSAESRQMMQALARDLADVPWKGLAAMAVSDDGLRFCNRFGLTSVGEVNIDGCLENVMIAERAE